MSMAQNNTEAEFHQPVMGPEAEMCPQYDLWLVVEAEHEAYKCEPQK